MVYVSWLQLESIARRYGSQKKSQCLLQSGASAVSRLPRRWCDAGATADSPAPNNEHPGDAVITREGIH